MDHVKRLIKPLSITLLFIAFLFFAWFFHHSESLKLKAVLDTVSLNTSDISRFASLAQSNQKKIEDLESQISQSALVWQIRQAATQVQAADLALQMERNPAKAIHLLESAKIILESGASPKTGALKLALMDALHRLKQFKPIPLVELNNQLLQAEQMLPSINFTEMPNVLAEEEMASNEKSTSSWFTRLLNYSRHFIIIRKTDEPLLPLVSRDMQELARQHILSLLTQAQFAAMQNNNAIYQADLNQIHWLCAHYYQVNHKNTIAFFALIDNLQKISVSPVSFDLKPTVTLFSSAALANSV